MTTCWACETELRPEWKFCIHCGVPVEDPEGDSATARGRGPVTPLATFGWIFAGIGGVLLLAAIAIALFVR